jgi:molybdenum cofactor synthesis domain-containing protein
MAATLRVGILTCSDKGSRGEREDTAGPAVAELLGPLAPEIVEKAIVPDDPARIVAILKKWADGGTINCLLTTGGTGLGPRDNTPEATRAVIERDVPGLAELMRQAGLAHTPMAALSRGVAGVRGRTLIINLPGSEKAVRENLAAIVPLLEHAVALIEGDIEH